MPADELPSRVDGDHAIRLVVRTVVEQERLVDYRDGGARVRQRSRKPCSKLGVRNVVAALPDSLLHASDRQLRAIEADEDQERREAAASRILEQLHLGAC